MMEGPKYRNTKANAKMQNRIIERRSRKNHNAPQSEGRWVGKTKIGILKPKVGIQTMTEWVYNVYLLTDGMMVEQELRDEQQETSAN